MKNNKKDKKNYKEGLFYLVTSIAILLILALPMVIRTFNLIERDGWFSFSGSYLGGIFGGVATLLAVVYTIKSNKKEQNRKEKIERQKTIQKSAVIVYYDFQFALDEIVQFMNNYAFFFLLKNKGMRTLPPNVNMSLYFDHLNELSQFYFDDNWISNVAELNIVSLNDHASIDIKRIYEIYGHLLTIKKSLEVNKENQNNYQHICDNAFCSMNNLVDISYVNGDGNCGLTYIIECDDGTDKKISVRTQVKDDIKCLMENLKKLSNDETID